MFSKPCAICVGLERAGIKLLNCSFKRSPLGIETVSFSTNDIFTSFLFWCYPPPKQGFEWRKRYAKDDALRKYRCIFNTLETCPEIEQFINDCRECCGLSQHSHCLLVGAAACRFLFPIWLTPVLLHWLVPFDLLYEEELREINCFSNIVLLLSDGLCALASMNKRLPGSTSLATSYSIHPSRDWLNSLRSTCGLLVVFFVFYLFAWRCTERFICARRVVRYSESKLQVLPKTIFSGYLR